MLRRQITAGVLVIGAVLVVGIARAGDSVFPPVFSLTAKGDIHTRTATGDASLAVGTDGECLKALSSEATGLDWGACGGGGSAWGGITGTLANQADLQTALDGKSATSHNHAGTYEPAGVSFTELSGAATDAQVPDTITVSLAAAATALASNGANCSGNNFALGVDASGAGECAQPSFSNLSSTVSIAQGGTTETASTEDAVLVGASTTDWAPKVLPSCSNATTSKLLYDTSTNTFSCGTDQTGAGGGGGTGYVFEQFQDAHARTTADEADNTVAAAQSATATACTFAYFGIPADYGSGQLTFTVPVQASALGGANNIRVSYEVSEITDSAALADTYTSGVVTVNIPAGTAANDVQFLTQVSSGLAIAAGDLFLFEFCRIGGDAADTYAGTTAPLGVRIAYTKA